jgi:adenylate cyclase
VGIAWRRQRYLAVESWLAAERPATGVERAIVLRQPLEGVITSATFWLFAAILFAVLNIDQSLTGALVIALTAMLGGATTCALLYLLHERVLRPVTARALEVAPPDRPVAPGVAGRLTMAWTLGTGVPALGVVAVTAVELIGGTLDDRVALAAAIFLGALALMIGFSATVFAARSVADPITTIRVAAGVGLRELDPGDRHVLGLEYWHASRLLPDEFVKMLPAPSLGVAP